MPLVRTAGSSHKSILLGVCQIVAVPNDPFTGKMDGNSTIGGVSQVSIPSPYRSSSYKNEGAAP